MDTSTHTNNLIWLDLEMTGLDPDRDSILEVAVIATDSELNALDEGLELVVFQPEEVLAGMNDWSKEHHEQSGLTEKVRSSQILLASATEQVLAYISKHVAPKTAPLCGNSIWSDRGFLRKYMPIVDQYLHYRVVDVSSVKELTRLWYPDLKKFSKQETHRALDDIRESIAELKYYREQVFPKQR